MFPEFVVVVKVVGVLLVGAVPLSNQLMRSGDHWYVAVRSMGGLELVGWMSVHWLLFDCFERMGLWVKVLGLVPSHASIAFGKLSLSGSSDEPCWFVGRLNMGFEM